jgi:hypothetical protein
MERVRPLPTLSGPHEHQSSPKERFQGESLWNGRWGKEGNWKGHPWRAGVGDATCLQFSHGESTWSSRFFNDRYRDILSLTISLASRLPKPSPTDTCSSSISMHSDWFPATAVLYGITSPASRCAIWVHGEWNGIFHKVVSHMLTSSRFHLLLR